MIGFDFFNSIDFLNETYILTNLGIVYKYLKSIIFQFINVTNKFSFL